MREQGAGERTRQLPIKGKTRNQSGPLRVLTCYDDHCRGAIFTPLRRKQWPIPKSTHVTESSASHLLRLRVRRCLELAEHRREDTLGKTPKMFPDVLHGVPDAQLVQGPRIHLLDGQHRGTVAFGEDHLLQHASDHSSRSDERMTWKTCT